MQTKKLAPKTMTIIDIHEFSTGINLIATKDGWHSNGFAGNYMNSTLANIPEAVRQEIVAELFKLSEDAVQETPALIGREVKLHNEEWSVLAVITFAEDYAKRRFAVTRFFLTEGLGKLNDLVTYQVKNKLFFDPFDLKEIDQPNQYNTDGTIGTDILPKVFDDYSSIVSGLRDSPLILSTVLTKTNGKIPIKAIHQLAQETVISENKLITWAYNVEGLKKTHQFLVIYSASREADNYLSKSLQVPIQPLSYISGEQEIKSIIVSWINQADIQKDHIVTINNALSNPSTYKSEFWDVSIFQQLGINNAAQGGYTPAFVRLYLLYSLIFPKEFSNFLKWLNKKNNGKDLNAEHYQVAIEFSQKLQNAQKSSNQLDPLQTRAFQGIDLIITNLANSNNDITYSLLANWLILDQMGIWGQVYHQFYKKELWNNIEQIAINKKNPVTIANKPSLLNTKSWKTITQDLTALSRNQKPNPKYLPLAQFFETLGDDPQSQYPINYSLSAIFYSLATKVVPNSLWKKLNLSSKQASSPLSSIAQQDVEVITIYRKLTLAEAYTRSVYTIVSRVLDPISIPLILLPTLFLIGFISGTAISTTRLIQQILPRPQPSISPTPQPSPSKISPSIKSKGWSETAKSLDALRDEFVKYHKLEQKKVQDVITQVLSVKGAYEVKSATNPDTKRSNSEIWIKEIKKFQDKTGANYSSDKNYGYIVSNDSTYNHLKCKVAEKLKISLNQPPTECNP